MIHRIAGHAVGVVFLFLATAALAQSQLSFRELPSEVEKTATDLLAECKEAGLDVDGNLEKTLDVHQLGNGKRVALFDPKRICAFKGNSVCSTDGCDVSIYVEHSPHAWALATKQTVLSDTLVEDGGGSTPLKVVLNMRGGNPPCKRNPHSTCIFELTWKGLNFAWKQLR